MKCLFVLDDCGSAEEFDPAKDPLRHKLMLNDCLVWINANDVMIVRSCYGSLQTSEVIELVEDWVDEARIKIDRIHAEKIVDESMLLKYQSILKG